jgi:hypothetical protein
MTPISNARRIIGHPSNGGLSPLLSPYLLRAFYAIVDQKGAICASCSSAAFSAAIAAS